MPTAARTVTFDEQVEALVLAGACGNREKGEAFRHSHRQTAENAGLLNTSGSHKREPDPFIDFA